MLKSIFKKLIPLKFRDWARTSLQEYIGYGELQANVTDLNSKFFNLQNKIMETHGNNDKEAKLKVNSIFYITEPWWKRNFWEPAVQLGLKDLIKSGSTVFDIGANLAGISILMSRLVGPKGTVCAFEASPRIIELTNGNIIASGLNNISLFNNAVYSESGKKISIYAGGHLNDSIYAQGEFKEQIKDVVNTLSIDDFVKNTNLFPDLIKMDIEGAEFDALTGMTKQTLIHKPFLILETDPRDLRCLELLKSFDYIAFDLSNYKQIGSFEDFPKNSHIRNLLYIHTSRLKETPFKKTPQFENIIEFDDQTMEFVNNSWYSKWISFEPGRYILFTQMEGNEKDEVQLGIEDEYGDISKYHAERGFLANHYPDLPFHVEEAKKCRIFLRILKNHSFNCLAPKYWQISKVKTFEATLLNNFNHKIA